MKLKSFVTFLMLLALVIVGTLAALGVGDAIFNALPGVQQQQWEIFLPVVSN